MHVFRQGDVLVMPVDAVPEGLEPVERENGRLILAHGEATGHAHAIADTGAVMFRDPKLNELFLKVDAETVSLVHDEHYTHILPQGYYKVVRQREYDDRPHNPATGEAAIISRFVAD